MNTPRFASAVIVLLTVVLLILLVVVLLVVLVILVVLLVVLVVLVGHDNYLLLKECNSSMSIYGYNIRKNMIKFKTVCVPCSGPSMWPKRLRHI